LAEVRRALAGRAATAGTSTPAAPRTVTPPELPASGDDRPAGVLCLLFEEEGETYVVLTRRSAHLRSHAGEVSFAGGRLLPGELALHAALREANEEIGLDTAAVEVIGELSPLTTWRSPALVHCFVATFPGPRGPGGDSGDVLRADASEVDRVFWVPLAGLVVDGVFHEELWPARPGARATVPVPFFELGALDAGPLDAGAFGVGTYGAGDDVVWGATGRLLAELLGHVLEARATGRPPEGTLVE